MWLSWQICPLCLTTKYGRRGNTFAHLALTVEQFLRKEEVVGSNPIVGSIIMKKYLTIIKSYFTLDTYSWLVFILAVIINISLWIANAKFNLNINSLIMATTFLLINFVLSVVFDTKGQIVSYILLTTALFCQLLLGILVLNLFY